MSCGVVELGLPLVIGLLAGVAWISAAILAHAAWRRPRIGALTERAVIAVVFAILGTFYFLVTVNTTTGYALLPLEAARFVVRLLVVVVLLIPAWWTFLYLSGRLGGDR